jgi:WhiB family redox-sensing transcriptional regulator
VADPVLRPDGERPAWQRDAACHGAPIVLFFPERGEELAPAALALCARCPVRFPCAAYALEAGLAGVWGGTTGQDRKRARRRGWDAARLLAETVHLPAT